MGLAGWLSRPSSMALKRCESSRAMGDLAGVGENSLKKKKI